MIKFWTLTFKVKAMKIMFLGITLITYVVDISNISYIVRHCMNLILALKLDLCGGGMHYLRDMSSIELASMRTPNIAYLSMSFCVDVESRKSQCYLHLLKFTKIV